MPARPDEGTRTNDVGDARAVPDPTAARRRRTRSRGVPGGRRPAAARVLPPHRDRGPSRARAGGPARGRTGRARPRPPACRRHRQRRRDEPDRRVAGLVQRAHHRPGRHGRHAVPRRLGHRRARLARPHRAPRRAPAARRPPGRRRHPGGDLRRHTGRGRVRRRHRVVDAPRGRPRGLGGGPRGDRHQAAHRPRQRPRRRRGLEQDARAVQQHRGLAARQPTRGDPAGGGRHHGPVPRVAGRQPLHLPRLPRVHPRRRRPGREPALSRERHRPRHPAIRPAGVRAGRPAEPVGPQEGPRAGAAHHHQGQLALDRAPGDLPRLRRRQGVRREGARHGRAAVPRHLRLQRVCGVDPPHPDPRRARGSPAGARRLHAGQPLRQGPRAGHGELPARRAAPDRPGRPRRHRPVGDAPPGAPQDQAVPALRHLRAVRLRPHLPAPRPLQHDGPAEDGGHPAADVRRGERGLHDARLRVRPGPAALRGPGAEGRTDPAGRRVRAGARDRRGDADLGRGPRRGPARGCGRRGRRPADRVVRQGFS